MPPKKKVNVGGFLLFFSFSFSCSFFERVRVCARAHARAELEEQENAPSVAPGVNPGVRPFHIDALRTHRADIYCRCAPRVCVCVIQLSCITVGFLKVGSFSFPRFHSGFYNSVIKIHCAHSD